MEREKTYVCVCVFVYGKRGDVRFIIVRRENEALDGNSFFFLFTFFFFFLLNHYNR